MLSFKHMGRLFFTTNTTVIAGRSTEADIRLPLPDVSRKHTSFEPNPDGTWTVTDLKSLNGTSVNGLTINEPTILLDGDTVQIGGFLLEIGIAADEALAA